MGNTDIVTYQLPVEYNKQTNELLLHFPPGLKIRFLNDLNVSTEGQFNILSFGEINLCSVENNIHLDSVNASIHLNSKRAVQLNELKKIMIINYLNDNNTLFDKRQNLLLDLNKCLNRIIENTSIQK